MWPELLDMTREESKRILRRVELEAYSSVVSAFRAQGDLSKDKKKLLHDLQQILSISTERHRAEVRRAVNDEKLATISENMSPNNCTQEWLVEGRRLVPLMPRLVPQTAFTVTANQAANLQAEKNAAMPSPSQTGIRDVNLTSMSSTPSSSGNASRSSRPSSPTSNVVVLPSGMSIHIKGGLNTEDEEDVQTRKRRRSTSSDSMVSPTGTPTPQVTYTTTMANMTSVSPMKITISKSPQSTPRVITSGSQTQKVILVSSAGQTNTPSIIQKSITVPVVRTTASTGTSTPQLNKSIIFPSNSSATVASQSNMVSMANLMSSTATTSTVVAPLSSTGTSTTAFLTPTISISRPRLKTIPRQKILQLPQQKPGVVIPMGPHPVQPSPQTVQGGVHIKSFPKQTPTIQIRQEGGMKIITQSLPAGASKILPKPSQLTTPSGTPVVVVSAGTTNAATSSVTMLNRPLTSTAGHLTRTISPGTKVLNIQTQGGKILSATKGSSVVTVNPKTLHLTAVKTASGTKPNVIVVQKTQPRRAHTPTTPPSAGGKPTTTIISSPFEKELVSFLQKQDPTKQYVVTTTTANLSRPLERKVMVTTPAQAEAAKQGAGIGPDSSVTATAATASVAPNSTGELTLNLEESQMASLSGVQTVTQPKVLPTQTMPSNEWFEYDVTDEHGNTYTHTAESADTAAAIQSLLDMQANGSQQKAKVTVQRSASVDIGQLSDQLNQQQFYTIEQAMTILNQEKETESGAATGTSVQSDQPAQVPVSAISRETGDLQSGATSSRLTSNVVTMAATQPAADSTNLSQEIVHGELDPQTGLFYVDKDTNHTESRSKVPNVIEVNSRTGAMEGDAPKSLDLLSSSLQQAQIDLDPFQFIEEVQNYQKSDSGAVTLQPRSSNTSESVSILNQSADSAVSSQTSEVTQVAMEPSEQGVASGAGDFTGNSNSVNTADSIVIQKVVVSQSGGAMGTQPAIRIRPSSFIPLQEAVKSAKSSTINITTHRQSVPGVVSVVPTIVSGSAIPSSESSIHVTVEPSGLDMSHMKMEDFTSQQLSDRGEYTGIDHMEEITSVDSPPTSGSGLSDSQGEGSQYLDGQFQLGKRKRRPHSVDESPPPQGLVSGWLRAAQGVLHKTSRYRGLNRDKTELNAAAWFTQPVDPADAPDYYSIVKEPMDFGTIKRKLDGMKYQDFEEFHQDMCLVRDNCCLYNPAGSIVRRDCDEVFTFYQLEYDKLMEKWQKTHIASPVAKKQKMESSKSPIRS